jgi:hypothetical protein
MKQRLRQLLDDLHSELAGLEAMDSEAREELVDLAETIAAVTGDAPPDDVNKIQQTVLEFETEYPKIAGILGQIADTLARLGI